MNIDKKILVILPDVDPCGITEAAVSFCNGFAARGGQVDVLLMSDCPDVSERGFADGIRFLHLKGSAKWWNLDSTTLRKTKNPFKKVGFLFLGGLKRLANRKNRWNAVVFRNKKRFKGYDAAVAYSPSSACCRFALRNVQAAKKVAFVHGEAAFTDHVGTWQPYLKEFDVVAYVASGVKEGFIARYPELAKNAVIVYTPLPSEEIRQRAQIPCPVAFSGRRLNLVTVSFIRNTVKGTGRIPLICQKLKERFPDGFHWYVVGGGPDLAKCQKKANKLDVNDHLSFLGPNDNPTCFLAEADLCIVPSITEGYPLIVAESLILGVPVVAARFSAVTEMISEGKNGLIAEQITDGIFDTIARLLEDPALLSKLKENCVSYQYDNDRSYKQFLDAIA